MADNSGRGGNMPPGFDPGRLAEMPREIAIQMSDLDKYSSYHCPKPDCMSNAFQEGRMLFEIPAILSPLALSFVGATDKESLAAIRTLEDKYGGGYNPIMR